MATPATLVNAKPGLPQAGKPAQAAPDPFREVTESIAFAFILAFLFRTFLAEAFVIPTGSMAPTLLGRNKDVVCPESGYKFIIGASDEVDRNGRLLSRIESAVSPSSRSRVNVRDLPVFKGDRILVNKFAYELADPARWDVVVFKYPEDPQTNYIKRLVGLPGEIIRIERGDVYSLSKPGDQPSILRKADPNKQRMLQIPVYDDMYPARRILAAGWPERFQPLAQTGATGAPDGWEPDQTGWKANIDSRVYSITKSSSLKWLRYQHILPTENDWKLLEEGRPLLTSPPRPELISDFCSYNAFSPAHEGENQDGFWVADLTVSGQATISEVDANGGEVIIELVRGIRRYRCRIQLPSGKLQLTRTDELQADGGEIIIASGQSSITGPGQFDFSFANVDQRLCIWINNQLLTLDQSGEYLPPVLAQPTEGDLLPVGIAAAGVTASVTQLRLDRDIYYRADRHPNDFTLSGQRVQEREFPRGNNSLLAARLHDPSAWWEMYSRAAAFAEFGQLRDKEYFVMGDNSPRSQDSRLWSNARLAANRHAVPREAMIGKAFFVFWPHGIPFMNDGKGYAPIRWCYHSVPPNSQVENYPELTFPFYPQWWRWSRIR
jgi:signal peptidase I